MFSYKLVNNHKNVLTWIDRSDGLTIPIDPDNTDYQQYLKWLDEGNQPLPADQQGD